MKLAELHRHIETLHRVAGGDLAADLLSELGTRQALAMLRRYQAVLYARRLLDEGVGRPITVARLVARFRVSRSTAERRIDAALKLRQNVAWFETRRGHSGGNNRDVQPPNA